MGIINNKYQDLSVFAESFKKASPFPYIVLDDFLTPHFFSKLSKEIVDAEKAGSGKTFNSQVEAKKWISINSVLPEKIQLLIDELNCRSWMKNLKGLTEIPSLIATEVGNTSLVNFHVMQPGGFLGPHVDHSYEPGTGIPHVLNIIIYLSSEWDDANGGATLFYDQNGKIEMARIKFKPNRAVLFLHTPYSFHCVEKIKNGDHSPRKSLYVDYYSESFKPYENFNLNFPNNWFRHGTTFKLPKLSDYTNPKNFKYIRAYFKYLFHRTISK